MDVNTDALLSSALQIREAIEHASRFNAIGHCATKIRVGRKARYDLHGIDIEDMDRTENETLVEELAKLYRNAPTHATGTLREPFHLNITRPGCKYDADIQSRKSTQLTNSKISPERDGENLDAKDSNSDFSDAINKNDYFVKGSKEEGWLKQLFTNASVSGYGDVRTQETKIDLDVRNAREIPASEFAVAPALLDTIRTTWAAHFWPAAVRVAPYKIHLYGPGGGFQAHRDTPEAGLVGTFLLGLGDSTQARNLEVRVQGARASNTTAFSACVGQWVAFYPDVPHRVVKLKKGYRAVLAFKVFRADDGADAACDAGVLQRVRAVTDRLSAPVGLFLEHKYCMGTQKLAGFDAVVYEALARRADIAVHLLPVVTKWSAVIETDADVDMGYYSGNFRDREIPQGSFDAPVYPITAAHVKAVAAGSMEVSFERWGRLVVKDPAAREEGLGWLNKLTKDVQFLATDLDSTTVTWSTAQEDLDYTGNESRPYSEDSVYLSYALVIVEKKL
ncbi:hypothetical protein BV25DRAFT_1994824 [Artomyces pyxidatus]|uniref:Uncharacterized protein n=1 Tax=Artomyces pyxidatus TaxID=48021 RepID=A0ACB8SN40_9AGAM|nr:hypothetical protein BV25DRAFT_1994824 [Artomyces pyxidatus]